MKKMLWVGLMVGSAAFAQSDSSTNVVPEHRLLDRLKDRDLLKAPPKFNFSVTPNAIVAPKACAAVRNALPPATRPAQIHIVIPQVAPLPGDIIDYPVPPCAPSK